MGSRSDLSGHLFQGRYFSNLINNVIELLEVSRYIHLNPVRAKMVDSPEKYMWSSYNKIVLDEDKFKDLVIVEEIYYEVCFSTRFF